MMILWYAALLARLALAGRVVFSDRLRDKHAYLALWMFAWSAVDVIRRLSSAPRWSWEYAQQWAYGDWLVLSLMALFVAQEVANTIRQYGRHNRSFLRCSAAAVAGIAILACLASACWLEFRVIRWDKPLLVQLTISADRVVTLAAALTLGACGALLILSRIHFRLPNLHAVLAVSPLYLLASAIVGYLNLALWPRVSLTAMQIVYDTAVMLMALALAWRLSPRGELEWEPPLFRPGYQRAHDAAMTTFTRVAKNALRRARKPWSVAA